MRGLRGFLKTGGVPRCVGIDLGDIVAKQPTTVAAYGQKRVAFDAWNVLYQFLSSIRQPDGTPLMDMQGRITSHLAGILYRTGNLVEAGVRPIWVFDGEAHPLKRETLAQRAARREAAAEAYEEAVEAGDTERARSQAQQMGKMTPDMADQAKALLRALGIPVVEAPSDGEAQAAWMCAEGLVDAVGSQDFDCLLYGTPRMVRNLTVTGRRKLPGKQVWVEVSPETIDLQGSLEAMQVTREQLVDVALLVGTDFHPGIKGIGPKKALALVKKEGSLEAVIDRLAANPEGASSAVERALVEQHESLVEREAIRELFLRPPHVGDLGDLTIRSPDADAVHELMVETHGFSPERVDGALARFESARGKRAQTGLFDFG